MHLGIYRFDGDPDALLAAYDRLLAAMPPAQLLVHLCAVRPDGITVYDTCPTEAVFRRFSLGAELREALAAAGLPEPTVDDLPVHAARGPGGAVVE